MPKLTSGITQKERLKVIQSIDMMKTTRNDHERQILKRYRDMVAREFLNEQAPALGGD
ncbi:MAG: hypothetical protein K1563_14860 [Candidatus Thiodiazotropha sp. (ex. Lucinisca nassula)]|nr:hypothetical protein [Candidatus Thiodiazotropha sp. (ex. Lucinisca nassula)]MBW9274958.1 hypothetical protein [Candidatus Thiodiazotropha sp. (ex. Lucinisca nassula)]